MIEYRLLEKLKEIKELGDRYNEKYMGMICDNKNIDKYKNMLNAKKNYEEKQEMLGKEINDYKLLTSKERDEIELLFLN